MTYEEKIKTARYLARVFFEYEDGLAISEKPSDLSWDYVYGMAKRHSVEALMFEVLGAFAKEEAPEALYADWSRDASIAGAKHITQRLELESLSKLFSENGIPYLLLKGFLIKKLYKTPSLRQMTDIDIFIGQENFAKVKALLLANGYALDSSQEVHDSFKKLPFIEIEIHKILHHDMIEYKIDNTHSVGENEYCRVMTEEDFLVFLLHHAKKHDSTGGAGIRTVFDFYLLFKKKSYAEKALLERLKKENLLTFYQTLKGLINFWFYGGEITEELADFEIYTVTGGTYGTLENEYLRKQKQKGKVAIFFERLFPPYRLMASRYPVLKKCPILLPVFYPVRFFSSLFNGNIKKNAQAMKASSKKKKELEKLSGKNAEKK